MGFRRMTRQVTRTAQSGEHLISEVVDGFDVEVFADTEGIEALTDAVAARVKNVLFGGEPDPLPKDLRLFKARVFLLESDER